ncbi:hypothetical protein [Shewanella gelidii]|uniref:Uncharacterized protein n=1 Tax=Shewanella gelidii TaxID=1642821 RepID=A0A917JTY4_9GAMM|nr:hypothetical protein [Shewanella gelidii]MCL1097919.1 hypothetical protein [Shewanella gelidii]GGI84672.1 hypothetical protein GCM10009332_22510 [Shewanella gelidii]
MNIYRLLVIVLVLLNISCSENNVDYEEAIYESLFLEIIGNAYDKAFLINSTDLKWFETYDIEKIKKHNETVGIDAGLLENLYAVNSKSYPIKWQPIMTTIVMLPSSTHESPNRDVRCGITQKNRIYRSYHTVSKVVFSDDGLSALVAHGYHCAPLSGATEQLILFKKSGNRWLVEKGIRLWVS